MPITRIPLRLQIARAITDALKEINPDNGYEFDLRNDAGGQPRVVRGRLDFGDSDPLPLVSINEPPLSVEPIPTKKQTGNTARAGEWDLIIQGWAKDNPTNPTDIAYQLQAEVSQRLARENQRARIGRPGARDIFGLGEKIISMTIGAPVVRPNEHISEQGVFYLVLTLEIAEDMAEPFG